MEPWVSTLRQNNAVFPGWARYALDKHGFVTESNQPYAATSLKSLF